MDSGNARSEEVLYRDQFAKVSPTWLTHEATSYAISTLIRVTFVERVSPPIRSLLLFFLTLGLVFFSYIYLITDVVPAAVAGVLLVISIILFISAIWYTFVKRPLYLIKAVFIDGTEINIVRQKHEQAHGLYRAIDLAKSRQTNSEDEFEDYVPVDTAEISEVEQFVRKRAAQKKRRRLGSLLAYLSRSPD